MQTTKKDFELFKKYFLMYSKKLGMNDIHFNFVHGETESYAHVIGNLEQRAYVIFFSTVFLDMKVAPKNFLKYLAYHEAVECLLYGLRTLAGTREYDENRLDSEIHSVINRLESIMVGDCAFTVEVEGEE